MPEDQAGAAMVRELGLPEPRPPATLAPAGLPSPTLMPRAPAFTSLPCYLPLTDPLLLPLVPRPPAGVPPTHTPSASLSTR